MSSTPILHRVSSMRDANNFTVITPASAPCIQINGDVITAEEVARNMRSRQSAGPMSQSSSASDLRAKFYSARRATAANVTFNATALKRRSAGALKVGKGRERRSNSNFELAGFQASTMAGRRQSKFNVQTTISDWDGKSKVDEAIFVDTNLTSVSSCLYGGKCQDHVALYTCMCVAAFTGSMYKQEKCVRKLKMWMHIVLVLVRLHRNSRNSLFAGTLYRHQLDHIDRTCGKLPDTDSNSLAMFNLNEYKANRQMRMSERAKEVLCKPPAERTEEEIYYATIALRGLSLIAGYPVRMQRGLAQYGSFLTFASKRVIVRQGQMPYAFYFILYGTVIVAIQPDDVQDAKTICFLKRDESFGELSIMNGTPRQSSVITQDEVELLAIDVHTYEQIFMVGGARNINDPDHNAFMTSLSFLKGFPLKLLENQEEEKNMMFAYFKRDAVMVRDSNFNDWIYVVKSGSVQVLKKLVKQDPIVDRKTGKLLQFTTDNDLLQAFTAGQTTLNRIMKYCGKDFPPPMMDQWIGQKENTMPSSRTFPEHTTEVSEYASTVPSYTKIKLGRSQSVVIRTQGRGRYKNTRSKTTLDISDLSSSSKPLSLELQKNVGHSSLRRKRATEENTQNKRTYLDDLDSGYNERAHIITEADRNPMFVHVQTLTKGDYFGLSSLVFPDQPGMCLVSNGCECILIRKQFYEEHCPSHVIRRLKTELSPYASDSSLQGDLLTTVNWAAYRKAVLDETCKKVTDRRKNRDWLRSGVTA